MKPEHPSDCASLKVAVVEWVPEEDGLADVICDELQDLGHEPVVVPHDAQLPAGTEVVFTFGPYGKYLHTVKRMALAASGRRTTFVHWNTEGIPDLRIPWWLVKQVAAMRSWLGRLDDSDSRFVRRLTSHILGPWDDRVLRFRYIGDYQYAHRNDLLHVFADSSAIYARLHRQNGLPTVFAPWGATRRWYEDLNLERDIDVLWIGQRGSKRRSRLLDYVRHKLKREGFEVFVIDNLENPFVYGRERTEIFNRAKITLNLTRTWFDDNFSRFAMAAPNRSLIVSEPLQPHCPQYEANVHYVSAPVSDLPRTIIAYLRDDAARQAIVERAFSLSTSELTFQNSVAAIMRAVAD